jgi:hypothetical protein
MNIYVASSWRNPFHQKTVELLISLGHKVYNFKNPSEGNHGFAWSDIDEYWTLWSSEEYVKALSHPVAEAGFKYDFDAMNWADCCVMILPCGRSANTEAGWMKGKGKLVYVLQLVNQEPELMYKIYDGIITSFEQLAIKFS